jgi:hypothetical protein
LFTIGDLDRLFDPARALRVAKLMQVTSTGLPT